MKINLLVRIITLTRLIKFYKIRLVNRTVPYEEYLKKNKKETYNKIKKDKIDKIVMRMIRENEIEKYLPALNKYEGVEKINIYFYVFAKMQKKICFTLAKKYHRYLADVIINHYDKTSEELKWLEDILDITTEYFYGYAEEVFAKMTEYISRTNDPEKKKQMQEVYDKYYSIFEKNKRYLLVMWDLLLFLENLHWSLIHFFKMILKIIIVVLLAYIFARILKMS